MSVPAGFLQQSGKKHRSTEVASRFRNGRLLLFDGCTKRDGVLTRNDFASNGVHLSSAQARLIDRLFDGPLTLNDAPGFFDSKSARRHIVARVNDAFRRVHGHDAILRTDLDGKKRHSGFFWVIALNPKVFKVSPVRLVPGADFSWRDVLPPTEQRAVNFLLGHSYSTLGQVSRGTGIIPRTLESLIAHRVNRRMRECGLPEIIWRTNSFPPIFFINPEFAKVFGEHVQTASITKDVFSKTEWRLIEFLASNPGKRPIEVLAALGFSEPVFFRKVKTIQEKAGMLGLNAFRATNFMHRTHYSLTDEFSRALGLKQAALDVTRLFSKDDLAFIRFAIEQPCIPAVEHFALVGLTRAVARRTIKRVETTCQKFGLKGLVKAGNNPAFYYATEEFARPFVKAFGWQFKRIAPVDFIKGKIGLKVHAFFSSNAGATAEECAIALGLEARQVYTARMDCNRVLEANGFPLLPSKESANPFADVAKATEPIVAYRIERGCWPAAKDLEKIDSRLVRAVLECHGGVEKIVRKLKRDDALTAEIAASDLGKLREMAERGWIDLTAFVKRNVRGKIVEDESDTVIKAAGYALLHGTELAKVITVLKKDYSDWRETVKAINALIPDLSDCHIEHDRAFANPDRGEAAY